MIPLDTWVVIEVERDCAVVECPFYGQTMIVPMDEIGPCDVAKKFGCTQIEAACNQLRTNTHRFYLREGMYNFHFKFSKPLEGENHLENALGR